VILFTGHAADIGALIAFLRAESPTPMWLVGTSMGTVSAASVAARLPASQVDGIVLTASVTVWSRSQRESLRDVRVGDIRVPVFVVHHKTDGCFASPAHEAARLMPKLTAAPRKALRFFRGGDTPRSGPCEPFAPHGFHGLDADVIAVIAVWIKGERP
jgi:pimeloyl-ACP methyl ester carboxylesterase